MIPCARQVPKIEARIILVSVPWSERVPPLTLRLTTKWRRLRSAVRLGRIVRRHIRFSREDEEFLDVARHASAQLGLGRRRVIRRRRTAKYQQASFQGQLDGAPLFLCGMCKGCVLAVELLDGLTPLRQ